MDEQYIRRLEKIEAELESALPADPDIAWMESSFGFGAGRGAGIPGSGQARILTAPGRDLLRRGGKRWRPLLMDLFCGACGGADASLPLAPLVEFAHTASLIHDDIEDGADERRGGPAIHVSYGVDTAINSGCFLYFSPLVRIDALDAPAERKLAIYRRYAAHMRRIHLGQSMDIAWHRDHSRVPAVGEYETMCRLKTGVLARLAAEIGCMAAGASEADAEGAGTIAEAMGVGFQILDDVRNLTTGNPGKKRGDDIVEGKKSLPVILHLSRRPEALPFMRSRFAAAKTEGIGSAAVEELIAELLSSGSVADARIRGEALIDGARADLLSFWPPSGHRDLILGLFGLIS